MKTFAFGVLALFGFGVSACSSGDENQTTGTGGASSSWPTCFDAPPAGAATPPPPKAYSGGTCPTLTPTTEAADGTVVNKNTIQTGGQARQFMLAVPSDLKDTEKLPVVFLWSWLGGSAQDFYDRAEVQKAVNAQRFLAVIPESTGSTFRWPYTVADSQATIDAELTFFDDMLACVSQQYNTNPSCVSSAGVSAGALWTDDLAHHRSEYLSSFISLSGGTGGTFIQPWVNPPRVAPSIVLWGGPQDTCIVINFQDTSHDLEQHLTDESAFFLECIHDCRHQEPPFPPGTNSKYEALWNFVFDHPYWLKQGQSPYIQHGIPSGMPSWCGIGTNSATPRTEDNCPPPAC